MGAPTLFLTNIHLTKGFNGLPGTLSIKGYPDNISKKDWICTCHTEKERDGKKGISKKNAYVNNERGG